MSACKKKIAGFTCDWIPLITCPPTAGQVLILGE